jgi:hypothetical protein
MTHQKVRAEIAHKQVKPAPKALNVLNKNRATFGVDQNKADRAAMKPVLRVKAGKAAALGQQATKAVALGQQATKAAAVVV